MTGLPPQRPDQAYRPPPGKLAPGSPQVVRARRVIIIGTAGGEFVYDASGHLRSANVGQTTTDPIQGLTCPQGFSTWNGAGSIVNLLSTATGKAAFFQYQDNESAVQGALIFSLASVAGTDPVNGSAYDVGAEGVNPAFADSARFVGAHIFLNQFLLTQAGEIEITTGSGATPPAISVLAPEQGTSGHLVMELQGASPDGTVTAALLIASEPTGTGLPVRTFAGALAEIQGQLGIRVATGVAAVEVAQTGDTNNRWQVSSTAGDHQWGTGAAATDTSFGRTAVAVVGSKSSHLRAGPAGFGLRVAEGANAKQGTAVLVAGTVVVANTSVTANSRIFLTSQADGGTPGFLRVSARVAGTSFTILSSSNTDTSTVAYEIFEPG